MQKEELGRLVAERNGEESPEDPGQRFADVFAPAQATVLPSPAPEAGDIAQRFQEVLESIGQHSQSEQD